MELHIRGLDHLFGSEVAGSLDFRGYLPKWTRARGAAYLSEYKDRVRAMAEVLDIEAMIDDFAALFSSCQEGES